MWKTTPQLVLSAILTSQSTVSFTYKKLIFIYIDTLESLNCQISFKNIDQRYNSLRNKQYNWVIEHEHWSNKIPHIYNK